MPIPRQHSSRPGYDYESLTGLLLLAVVGTVLAGAAFPSILAVCEIAFYGNGPGEAFSLGGYIFAVVLLGGMIGAALAFCVSVPVAVFAAAIGRLIGITGRDIWFASLVGGWTGFFATHLLFGRTDVGARMLVPVALAVAMGQVGAGGFVWITRRKVLPAGGAGSEIRMGLRQLFGITTAVAIIACFAQSLRSNDQQIFATAQLAIGIQAGIIGLAVAISAYRRSRDAAQPVSREATTRSA